MTEPTQAGPRPVFFAYVILDPRQTPPTPVGLELSRSAAREKMQWFDDADHLRIRRFRATIYPS